jgi:hypothetical protein
MNQRFDRQNPSNRERFRSDYGHYNYLGERREGRGYDTGDWAAREYASQADSDQYDRDDWGSGGRGDYGSPNPGREFGRGNSGSRYAQRGRPTNGSEYDRSPEGQLRGYGDTYYGGSGSSWQSDSSRSGEQQNPRGQFTGHGPKGYRRSDERIHEDVNEALAQHGELDAREIEVKVQNGEVTLSGTVTERQFKRLAEDLAERCSGVHDVHNQIRVSREGDSSEPRQDMKSKSAQAANEHQRQPASKSA